jgi:PA14 domain
VPADGGYDAEYFANRDLQGAPVLTRQDNAIDFNWGGGTPGDSVPADNFSARWTKSVAVAEEGMYRFTVTGDDGVRLFVDGVTVLDKWFPQGATTYTATRQLTQGAHQVVLEYFEAGGDAVARFSYERTADPPPPPPAPFAAEYFGNSTLSGQPVLTRSDEAIDFDWGDGAPSPVVPANLFSARWTRTKSYAAGTYRFSVTGDDGIRVLVDGTQVVDGWIYQAPTTYTADVPLSEGEHTVVVEYFEHTAGAVARFSESRLADPPP